MALVFEGIPEVFIKLSCWFDFLQPRIHLFF